jgi:hypothetical protein
MPECEITTPFAVDVVPEVKRITAAEGKADRTLS